MLPQLLRNMADYLEKQPQPLIHPTEKPRPKKIYKRKYNELNTIMEKQEKKKAPPLPKGKRKMSNLLNAAFKRYNIDPYVK
jgi:hypothetical protein